MGRPFRAELGRLDETYLWANSLDSTEFSELLISYLSFPLVAVGSGGSLSTAHFAATFHQQFSGKLAKAMTPLEAVTARLDWRQVAVLILTAGGTHPDVLGCFREFVRREPMFLGVVCCRPESRLVREAGRSRNVDQFLLRPPSGKDGFLATNTLLASAVVLARAYGRAAGSAMSLPPDLDAILGDGLFEPVRSVSLREKCLPLWERNTLTVLHSPPTHPAAVDLESKFVEAALGDIHVADFRNFAHGRHHWLAHRGISTGVLALAGQADSELADRTLGALPATIPIVRIDLPGDGPTQSIAALVRGFAVAGLAGEARGIDPGSPKVPAFGRRLYHLDAYRNGRPPRSSLDVIREVAIERKTRCRYIELDRRGLAARWRDAFDQFSSALARARFRGIVLDYDGTLCDPRDRLSGPRADVVAELVRLLRLKVPVGVATGRGRSVGAALREALPRRLWEMVRVGYYNGSDIADLNDTASPVRDGPVAEPLTDIHRELADHFVVTGHATLTLRPHQLTVEVQDPAARSLVWSAVAAAVYPYARSGVLAVTSSHSIDILAPGVTKRAVVEDLLGTKHGDTAILCIGDRGEWLGNDFELLSLPHSLSADEPSARPESGWNLAPPGQRWAQATLYYLGRLKWSRGGLRLRLDSFEGA